MKRKLLWRASLLILAICDIVLVLYGYNRGVKTKKTDVSFSYQEETEWEQKKKSGECIRRVALTFDDGPVPMFTRQLLEGLKKREVRVSFFVTGEHAKAYPELIRQMKEDGHLIGNHTYHHVQLTKAGREQFEQEITMTNEVIEQITGERPLFIRPPYGSWDKRYEEKLNMLPVLWNIDPLDWCTTDAGVISRKVLSQVKDNDIILMHDGYESSVTAALLIVDELKRRSYEFVTVDELILE